jgi:hypothetical protein
MKSSTRKILSVIIPIAAVLLIGCGLYALWARPGRLSTESCRDLVVKAWDGVQSGELNGTKVLDARFGKQYRTYKVDSPLGKAGEKFADAIKDAFPQGKPDEAFFKRFDVKHMGRVLVFGRACEKVRISPSKYDGNSTELWIDPKTSDTLGCRRYDSDGRFVAGYRFKRPHYSKVGRPEGEPDSGLLGESDVLKNILDSEMISSSKIEDMAMAGSVVLPERLPEGFKLIGGRNLPLMNSIESVRRGGAGGGGGMGRGMGLGGPGGGLGPKFMRGREDNIQIIFSDGLNTISLIQYSLRPQMEQFPGPEKLFNVLNEKAAEINRLYHVSMAGRGGPRGLILMFGEVSEDTLQDVLASIQDKGFGPPPGMTPGLGEGGPGMPPPPDNSGMPPMGGMGEQRRYGQPPGRGPG